MTCEVYGSLTICRPNPRFWDGAGAARTFWCFGCRARTRHWLWIHSEPFSYYEPIHSWRCDRCWEDRTEFPA